MTLGKPDESNNPDGTTKQRSYTCPKCGEDQYNLPLHMQSCYGGDEQ